MDEDAARADGHCRSELEADAGPADCNHGARDIEIRRVSPVGDRLGAAGHQGSAGGDNDLIRRDRG